MILRTVSCFSHSPSNQVDPSEDTETLKAAQSLVIGQAPQTKSIHQRILKHKEHQP